MNLELLINKIKEEFIMKTKWMILLIMSVFFSFTLFAGTYSGGDGTEGNPYQIADLDDLAELSTTSADWGAYFIQTADIDATAGGISPIGSTSTPFSGNYDGQGSVIPNLTISQEGSDNIGLFGYVEDGVIKNLGVTSADITGNDYSGVLAGQTRGSSTVIDHCFTSGSVTGNNFVGGLVGYNLLGATIQNCGSRVSVTGEEYVGGLAGANLETINNCYATGFVSATTGGGGLVDGNVAVTNSFWDTETSGLANSEGGTGKTSSELKDIATYTNTATSGLTTAWDFVGTTNNDAGTDDWWNMNLISTKTANDGYPVPSWWIVTDEPGGDGSSETPYQIATLNNLYWLSEGAGTAIWDDNKYFEQPADIAAKSTAYINKGEGFTPIGNSPDFNGSYDGQNHAIDYLFINRPGQNFVGLFGQMDNGGLSNLGLTDGNVTGKDNTGLLVGWVLTTNNAVEITNCSASGSVAGEVYVGGLVGKVQPLSYTITITDCYSSGSVEGALSVGGLIGRFEQQSITLENSYSTADLTTEGTCGGLIGGILNSSGGVTTISSCYSSGDVTISKEGEFTNNAGGLVGLIVQAGAGSKIENCYSRGDIIDNATSNSGEIGGLIGEVGTSNISINNCYSTGAVPEGGTGNTGGLIGNLLAGSGTACFWNTTTSGTTVGVGNTSDPTWVTGETTANMQTESTFTNAGWDFTDIWAMDGSTNDGYAYLQGNNPPGTILSWTGNSSSDWNTPGNWSGNFVPSGANNIVIPDVALQPTISSAASANDLSIESGTVLTIAPAGSLTVNGTLANAAGNSGLIIQSTAAGTGSLISAAASVPATVQRYIDGSSAWHLVSSPVNGATAETFAGHYLQFFTEATADWTDIVEPATTLTAAQGYALWSGEETYTFEGNLNSGDVSIATTQLYEDPVENEFYGWNLLGNPYPSSIDWAQLDDTWGAVYYYTGTTYATWNNGAQTNDGTQYVAPGQGFFISSDGSDFELTNAMRTHEGTSDFFKNGTANDQMLLLQVSNAQGSDEACIRFNAEASDNFDRQFDAWKIMAGTDNTGQLYTFADNGILSIDTRPACNTVQLGFSSNASGQFSFTLAEIKNIPDATLEDTKTGKRTNLREKPCTFHWEPGDDEMRFKLHLNAVGIDESQISENGILIYAADGRIFIKNGNGNGVDARPCVSAIRYRFGYDGQDCVAAGNK
jgi:hypothetical protein